MDPGTPRVYVVPEDLEEVGIPEATTDIMKTGEESALHPGKGTAVTVIALRITMLGTVTTVPAPLTVKENRTTGNSILGVFN